VDKLVNLSGEMEDGFHDEKDNGTI
jgi:hypothetical protein